MRPRSGRAARSCPTAVTTSPTGPCQRPCPATSWFAASGPHDPGAYGCTGGGESSSGCMMRQFSSTASCRLKRELSPTIAACSSTSYGVAPSPPWSANSRSSVTSSASSTLPRRASTCSRTPVEGSSLITSWLGSGLRSNGDEAEAGRMLEHDPHLRLRGRQPLAAADEERDARPAPRVDVETQRRVGLGRRVRRDAVDVEVALVLAAHVVGGIGGERSRGRASPARP